jgi:WD40 repeat protein
MGDYHDLIYFDSLGVIMKLHEAPAHKRPMMKQPRACRLVGVLLTLMGSELLEGVRCSLAEEAKSQVILDSTFASSLLFTPDGKTLITAGSKTITLWDFPSLKSRATLKGHRSFIKVNGLATTPDGSTLASADDHAIRLWNVATGKMITEIMTREPIRSIAFSKDGKILAWSSPDKKVRLWDTTRREVSAIFVGHTGELYQVAFSPRDNILASASGELDETVKLWDVSTGKNPLSLKGHTDGVIAVTFSPDGKTLATGGWDHVVKLWDVPTRKERTALKGHTERIQCVKFTPDGASLASCGDEHIKLWDVGTGKERTTLKAHRTVVISIAITPDGKTLVSNSYDGEVRLWDMVPPTRNPRRPKKGG